MKAINLILLLIVIGSLGYMGWRKMPKFDDGQKAPDFAAQTFKGEDFKLSELQGNIVLLDFWGSWCGPCLKENPQLVRLYNTYKSTQFKNADKFIVVSIGLEKNESNWHRAIESYNLDWPYHISHLKRMRDPIAKLYGVREIPTKYLIDEKGNIIGVNQSFEELDAYLAKRAK